MGMNFYLYGGLSWVQDLMKFFMSVHGLVVSNFNFLEKKFLLIVRSSRVFYRTQDHFEECHLEFLLDNECLHVLYVFSSCC